MKSYLITYDLRKPGQNYDELYKAIKDIGTWWHCLESNWIVKSNLSSVQIRDKISPHIDKNDKLFVALLSGEGAWMGFDTDCSKWLKDNL